LPANRPNRETTQAREALAYHYRQMGMLHEAIARKLGISRRGVGLCLERAFEREKGRLSATIEALKLEQTAQLEYIIEQALRAWRMSLKPRSRASEKAGDDGTTTHTEAIDQTGDPRHLATAMAAMDRIRSLWGLDIAAATQEPSSVSDAARKLADRIGDYERRIAQAAGGTGPAPGPDSAAGIGAGGLPVELQPVQRDGAMQGTLLVETGGDL
jgi:hypothetical protein